MVLFKESFFGSRIRESFDSRFSRVLGVGDESFSVSFVLLASAMRVILSLVCLFDHLFHIKTTLIRTDKIIKNTGTKLFAFSVVDS